MNPRMVEQIPRDHFATMLLLAAARSDRERRPIRSIEYHFLPESVQACVADREACERWRVQAEAILRASYPGVDCSVSYELGVPGTKAWVAVDGNERPAAAAAVVDLLHGTFERWCSPAGNGTADQWATAG
jgi:hypothetical protein